MNNGMVFSATPFSSVFSSLLKEWKIELFFLLIFLHGIRASSETLVFQMTKYEMATERQRSISKVTSNNEVTVSNNNGGSYGNLLPITGHKLNMHNYLQWSQSVMMFICGKGKDDHLGCSSS